MISFRYHIVSIVSVFLALAIGVALGGGPLKGEVDNTLVKQVQTDRATKVRLNQRIALLRDGTRFQDAFAAASAPALLKRGLRGRAVTLMVLPSANPAAATALGKLVQQGGGDVTGTIRIAKKLLDAGNKQLVDELGRQLEGSLSSVKIPTDASPYERVGDLVGRAITTTRKGGRRVDAPASSILSGLSAAELMSAEGTFARRGSLLLVVAGPGEGGAAQRKSTNTIVLTMLKALAVSSDGVVLAGPTEAARPDGVVNALRQDVVAARDISTTDSLTRTAGKVVAVLALAAQGKGTTGQYGAVDAATGAMPGADAG